MPSGPISPDSRGAATGTARRAPAPAVRGELDRRGDQNRGHGRADVHVLQHRAGMSKWCRSSAVPGFEADVVRRVLTDHVDGLRSRPRLGDVRTPTPSASKPGTCAGTATTSTWPAGAAERARPRVRAPVSGRAPVELTLELPAPVLDELSGGPRRGYRRDRTRRHRPDQPGPSQGQRHVEVETHIDGSTLWITPRANRAAPQVALPPNTPAYRVQLPELPRGLRSPTSIWPPGVVKLTGRCRQWHMTCPRPVGDLIGHSAFGRAPAQPDLANTRVTSGAARRHPASIPTRRD